MAAQTPSPSDLFALMQKYFVPEAAAGAQATVHFELTGPQGGKWTVVVGEGRCDVKEGWEGTSSLTITASTDDYYQVMQGTLAPMTAFMQGRVKIRGDIGVALKMQNWFRPPQGA